jgi:hypothetical protein
MTVQDDIAAINTSLTRLSADKEACTGFLTSYVQQFNALAQLEWGGTATQAKVEAAMTSMAAILTTYVHHFDAVTMDLAQLNALVATATRHLVFADVIELV